MTVTMTEQEVEQFILDRDQARRERDALRETLAWIREQAQVDNSDDEHTLAKGMQDITATVNMVLEERNDV